MRAKSVVATRQKKKKYFRMAKGYYATKKNRWRMTIQQLEKSMRYMYVGRKDRSTAPMHQNQEIPRILRHRTGTWRIVRSASTVQRTSERGFHGEISRLAHAGAGGRK